MKRVVLFLATNIAILLVLSIAWAVLSTAFGFGPYLDEQGINYGSLLVFSAVFGFGGALISLAMSKSIAKWTTRAQVITQPRNGTEAWLLSTVQRQAQQAGIRMPEVAIYQAPEPNAFATGARRNAALVAVSTGLLQNMRQNEVEAVLAHEVSHVANGDMVTLTLIQGVVNTFVIFISRVIGMIVDRVVFRNERGHGPGFWITAIVAQVLLGILASIIVMWFSRQREYRADAGGAHLAGRENMIAALERLKGNSPGQLPDALQAFGISGGGRRAQFARLFSSHPPLDDRIRALREQRLG
ncbi:MAG: protease HtpX [Chromatiales bacterium]|nr:protease HtpX [Chromatiales bacterium]